jgi:acyl-CoA thioester hydrolase
MESAVRAHSHYLHWTRDLVRYGDTDRQGHVNNAVFVTFLETGRVAILYDPKLRALLSDASFVIVKLALEYHAEIQWPAEVSVGTAVQRIGRSSVSFAQGLFVADRCVATSESVVVMIDPRTRRSSAIPEAVRLALGQWSHPDAAAV